MNKLISQVPYVYEQSEKFAKPPKPHKDSGQENQELLKTAERFGIKVPSKVKYQMGDPDWNK